MCVVVCVVVCVYCRVHHFGSRMSPPFTFTCPSSIHLHPKNNNNTTRTRPRDIGGLGSGDLPPAALEEEAELLEPPAAAPFVVEEGDGGGVGRLAGPGLEQAGPALFDGGEEAWGFGAANAVLRRCGVRFFPMSGGRYVQ